MNTNIEVVVEVSGESVAKSLSSDYEKAFEMICMIDEHVADWYFTKKVAIHFSQMLKGEFSDDSEYATWGETV